MASITIRNLDDSLKQRLRQRAASHGRSMEQEARDILRASLTDRPETHQPLGSALHALFAPLGGVDLEPLPRDPARDPPDFA